MGESLLQAAVVINVLATMVRTSTPLLFGAIGEVVTERSGVMNMGLEGTMLTAAFVGFLVAERSHSLLLAVVTACLAGGLFSLILAFMAITLDVDQIITGLAMNLLASGGTLFWFRIAYTQTTSQETPLVALLKPWPIPLLSEIPYLGPILFSHNALTYLAFLLVPVIWFGLYRTKRGLQIRSLGEDPRAAAKRIAEDILQMRGLQFSEPRVETDLYEPKRFPGQMHYDVWFLVDARVPAGTKVDLPSWYAELTWHDPRDLPAAEWARGHEDVAARWLHARNESAQGG